MFSFFQQLFSMLWQLVAWAIGWLIYWLCWLVDAVLCMAYGLIADVIDLLPSVSWGPFSAFVDLIKYANEYIPVVECVGFLIVYIAFRIVVFTIHTVIRLTPTIG